MVEVVTAVQVVGVVCNAVVLPGKYAGWLKALLNVANILARYLGVKVTHLLTCASKKVSRAERASERVRGEVPSAGLFKLPGDVNAAGFRYGVGAPLIPNGFCFHFLLISGTPGTMFGRSE